jgi:Coagulation Factor Xa inhibitory site
MTEDICEQFKGQLCGDICIPVGKTFKCACKDGFMLDVDGKTCTILPGNNRFEKNLISLKIQFDF